MTEFANFQITICDNFLISAKITLIVNENAFLAVKLVNFQMKNEPGHEKTNVFHMRKQRRRSASRYFGSAGISSWFIAYLLSFDCNVVVRDYTFHLPLKKQ